MKILTKINHLTVLGPTATGKTRLGVPWDRLEFYGLELWRKAIQG